MAACWVKSLPIKGLTDKRNITLNVFPGISYQCKSFTVARQKQVYHVAFSFLTDSISYNPKHWSNEAETLKQMDEIIKPYVVNNGKELNLPSTQKHFQRSNDGCSKKKVNIIVHWTYSCSCKHYSCFPAIEFNCEWGCTQKEFYTYYSTVVQQELISGNNIEDIDFDLKLSTIKLLHVQWLVNFYNSWWCNYFKRMEKG